MISTQENYIIIDALELFYKKNYNEECLGSVNEIFYALEKEQDIKCKLFTHKKLKKNYIIIFQIHLGHFLLEGDCACEMVDGTFFQFGDECLGKSSCYNCLSLALEIMKRYCKYKFFNEQFFFFWFIKKFLMLLF